MMNFCKKSYQPILRLLYTEAIKLWGEISLHKHFINDLSVNKVNLTIVAPVMVWYILANCVVLHSGCVSFFVFLNKNTK